MQESDSQTPAEIINRAPENLPSSKASDASVEQVQKDNKTFGDKIVDQLTEIAELKEKLRSKKSD